MANENQLAATFAFLTYIGESLTSPQPAIAEQEADLVQEGMTALGLAPEWDLVWGPLLYRFPLAELYDNLMFVARSGDDYVVAVRGTNGKAVLDWIFEDFWIVPESDWSAITGVTPPPGLHPRVTAGTHLGLSRLLGTPLRGQVPGTGTHLVDFLRSELRTRPAARVTVTGHSLGGALSPTLTLFLADTQGRSNGWDPGRSATLGCVAFAGPTPGNRDFARYYDQRIGAVSARVVNPLDLVPNAWDVESLKKTPELYSGIEHPVRPTTAERLALDGVVDLLEIGGLRFAQYNQSGSGLVTLGELKDHDADSFMAQAAWQHVEGYEDQLGISGINSQLSQVFADWCSRHPGVCPDPKASPRTA